METQAKAAGTRRDRSIQKDGVGMLNLKAQSSLDIAILTVLWVEPWIRELRKRVKAARHREKQQCNSSQK